MPSRGLSRHEAGTLDYNDLERLVAKDIKDGAAKAEAHFAQRAGIPLTQVREILAAGYSLTQLHEALRLPGEDFQAKWARYTNPDLPIEPDFEREGERGWMQQWEEGRAVLAGEIEEAAQRGKQT